MDVTPQHGLTGDDDLVGCLDNPLGAIIEHAAEIEPGMRLTAGALKLR
ncbi:MAG: hypothetical protein QJR12_12255 [Mycobacterium sp.]|nr:hypothetical protein [Mycobacterium sp.]MDI3315000.1 hypothetical protein [Mycobacterium sp.]